MSPTIFGIITQKSAAPEKARRSRTHCRRYSFAASGAAASYTRAAISLSIM